MNKLLSTTRILTLAGLTLTLGLAACDKRPDGQMSDSAAATSPKESADLGAALNDTGITAKVKTRLASDSRTSAAGISVETNNGVVTLTGTTASADAKSAAEELARNVPEVTGVDNRISAPSAVDEMAAKAENTAEKAGVAIDDTWITTKVKSALLADAQTSGTQITVDTKAGVVSLSGTAASASEHQRAVDIAKNIEGVKSVNDSGLKTGKH
jgi:hyperosmotically inducible protein